MDIKIELERSDYVKKRLSLMKTLQIPTLSEAKSNLGLCLAQILFDQCDDVLKVDFGLMPLKGTGDELWLSPSDLLIGKVALKPPFTSQHIQALTHQGILKIGEQIEQKFWNETKMHEENYFELRKRHMMDQFEEVFRAEAKSIEMKERLCCQNQIQKILEEFNGILLDELDELERKLKKEREESLRAQKLSINLEWQKKFNEAISDTVQKITTKFLEELDRQKSILMSNFRLELQKAHVQKSYDITLEKTRCKESIKELRHNLECKNIANMMYVLCMERRKCCDEKETIEKHYVEEITKLQKMVSYRDEQIKTLTEEKDNQIKEVKLRETCVLEILRQFQKFINFALRAAPTQAEFLLSIEKMMAFELTNTVLKSNYSRLKPCTEILPWKYHEKSLEPPKDVPLEIQDHHNCFKELAGPRSDEGLAADDYLPAFNYRNKLYLREDFRNMVSQGIHISKSNELWSKDVEILIHALRRSVSDTNQDADEKSISKQFATDSGQIVSPRSIGASSVQFRISDDCMPHKTARLSQGSSRRQSEERRGSLKPGVCSLHTINFEQIGTVERKPALIATTNSLELILKRGSVRHLKGRKVEEEEEEDEEKESNSLTKASAAQESVSILKSRTSVEESVLNKEIGGSIHSIKKTSPKHSVKDYLVVDVKDSVIMKKASLLKKSTEFNVSPKDSIELMETKIEIRRKLSKLVTAKNSLELLRESKTAIISGPLLPVSVKDASKQKPTISCAKIKCSERCYLPKANIESTTDDGLLQIRKDSAERSIKLSHIEIFKVDNHSKEASVSINTVPTVYDTGSTRYSTDLREMYMEKPKSKKPKRKKPVAKAKPQKIPKAIKVVGDMQAKEHLQTTEDFTEGRVHSLIELIKDNPILMRTFTACRR